MGPKRHLYNKHTNFSALTLTIFYAILLLPLAVSAVGYCQPESEHQQMIHEMGKKVMPFDLSKTQHIFEMTDNGGIEQVIIRNKKDSDQLPLIRQHLQHEAMRFSRGDFSDPMSLHGANMPGIKDMMANVSRIKITYTELVNGAQLTFETKGIYLITAIHRWFGAQLSDHGADATYR